MVPRLRTLNPFQLLTSRTPWILTREAATSCATSPRESSHGSSSGGLGPPPLSPPSTDETGIVLSPPPIVLPFTDQSFDSSFSPVDPQLPFSTSRFVRLVEARSQGTVGRSVAETLMEATRDMLQRSERRVVNESWRKGDLENERYLFQAALSELKASSQVKSRNDSVILRSMTASLQRDTEAIGQRLKEDMHQLRSNIQLEMNVRKEETSTDLKKLDRAILDLNSKFTILLGEARTEQETTKWVSTRRVLGALVVLVVGVVLAATLPRSSATEHDSGSTDAPPTVEELGVVQRVGAEADGHEADASPNWFWSTTNVEPADEKAAAPFTSGK